MLQYLLQYQDTRKQAQAEKNRRPLGTLVFHHHLSRPRSSSFSSLGCLLILTTFPNTCSVTELTILLPESSSFGPHPLTCSTGAPAHSIVESLLQFQLYFLPAPPLAMTPWSSSTSSLTADLTKLATFVLPTARLPLAPFPLISPSSTPVQVAPPSNAPSSRYHLLSPRSHPPASSSFF